MDARIGKKISCNDRDGKVRFCLNIRGDMILGSLRFRIGGVILEKCPDVIDCFIGGIG